MLSLFYSDPLQKRQELIERGDREIGANSRLVRLAARTIVTGFDAGIDAALNIGA